MSIAQIGARLAAAIRIGLDAETSHAQCSIGRDREVKDVTVLDVAQNDFLFEDCRCKITDGQGRSLGFLVLAQASPVASSAPIIPSPDWEEVLSGSLKVSSLKEPRRPRV
jgi:hypothetical protein